MRARGLSGLLLLTAAGTALLLSGCAPWASSGYSVLDREVGTDDTLPTLDESEPVLYDTSSVRFAGEYEGDRLFLARGADNGSALCLLVVADGADEALGGCGGDGLRVGSGGGPDYQLWPDDAPVPDGAEQAAPNVLVFD